MRIEVVYRSPDLDGRADRTAASLRAVAGELVGRIRVADVYLIEGVPEVDTALARELFSDPVAQELFVDDPSALFDRVPQAAVAIEVSSKPGVTDPVALTARTAIEASLGRPLGADAVVQSARTVLVELAGEPARPPAEFAARLAAALHNPLIQQAVILERTQWQGGEHLPARYSHRLAASPQTVERIDLVALSDRELSELSRERLLALELAEMRAIQAYFRDPETHDRRIAAGLDSRATDVELEMIAQTWSEHCKHKIFNATIHYREAGRSETIRSLFATYIKRTTDEIAPRRPFLRSVFHDNSGVISFDDEHLLCFKVETHNSPSALDPYGGAITGIVGVNRDILGTGKGAKPIFNTDVLCFGDPDTPPEAVGTGLLHPQRVLHGVHEGIVDGGNQSGIPVVAGGVLFDESFVGKPLVFCGTGGILPAEIGGEAAWIKHVAPGDLAVMVGGRIGKDGIHGATFSSLALDETSPTSAVQIGDPITQKKMSDFLLEARDLLLYRGITDNGAGGLSSSLGEMAEESGGVRIDLDRCPLKYQGLAPWEILVSESQERMSLAVAPETAEALLELSHRRGVEATVVGEFTDSGFIDVRHGEQTVGLLSIEFLHHGLPTMELDAEWSGPAPRRFLGPEPRRFGAAPPRDGSEAAGPASALPARVRPGGRASTGEGDADRLAEELLRLLADPSIASKEGLVRQFDHEVGGGSVLKPFVGEEADGPGDGAVLRPVAGSERGVTVTHGICPNYSELDAYDMAMCAVDEAVRAHVALGGDPELACALDNFCWPDPVESGRTPDGRYKLAQLVRACRGLREACLAYSLPLVSGKDSMKNDAQLGGRKVSIKPTLLVSLMGIVEDVRRAVSSDFKRAGDLVYLLGPTRGELGGSAYERLLGRDLGAGPRVVPGESFSLYSRFHRAARRGLVASCHDLADGGLAVALAEAAFGGRLGAELSLPDELMHGAVSDAGVDDRARLLFCETPSRFLATVRAENRTAFERSLEGSALVLLGRVRQEQRVVIRSGGGTVLSVELEEIGHAWKGRRW